MFNVNVILKLYWERLELLDQTSLLVENFFLNLIEVKANFFDVELELIICMLDLKYDFLRI